MQPGARAPDGPHSQSRVGCRAACSLGGSTGTSRKVVGQVTLSQHEQRVLDEIETSCSAEDPAFVEALDLEAVRRRRERRSLLAKCLFLIGGSALLVGAGISQGLLSAGVILGFYGFVTLVVATVLALRNRLPRRRSDGAERHRQPD